MLTFQSDIKEKNFKRFYLFYGDEDYLKNQWANDLLHAIMPNLDDMNYSRFIEREINIKSIIDLAETMPFFADRRVIFLNNSGFFNSSCDEFAEYMETAPDYVTFIFVEKDVKKTTKCFKLADKLGATTECLQPSEAQINTWLVKMAKEKGKTISNRALAEFVSRCDESMDNMKSEMEKLIQYVGEAPQIEYEDVCEICIKKLSLQVFDMIDAIAEKNPSKVLYFYHDMLASKNPPQKILGTFTTQFMNILSMKSLRFEGMSPDQIADKMKYRTGYINKCLNTSRNFTIEEMESLLEEAAELDMLSKTGRIDMNIALETLMVKYASKK